MEQEEILQFRNGPKSLFELSKLALIDHIVNSNPGDLDFSISLLKEIDLNFKGTIFEKLILESIIYKNRGLLFKIFKPFDNYTILAGHKQNVIVLRFNHNNTRALSGSSDTTAILWDLMDLKNVKRIGVLKSHAQSVISVAFNSSSELALTGSFDKSVILWDLNKLEKIAAFEHNAAVFAVLFTLNDKQILTGMADGQIILWDLKSRNKLVVLRSNFEQCLCSIDFNFNGKFALTGSFDGKVQLWDLQEQDFKNLAKHSSIINQVAFVPHKGSALIISSDNTISLYDLETQKNIKSIHYNYIGPAGISSDGKFLLVANYMTKFLSLSKIKNLKVIGELKGPAAKITAIDFNGECALVAFGKQILLWNLKLPDLSINQALFILKLNKSKNLPSELCKLLNNNFYKAIFDTFEYDQKTCLKEYFKLPV